MIVAVIGPTVQGQPVVYISAFVVVVLLAFARPWAESLVTVAHEGGHMVMVVLTGNALTHFYIGESRSNRDGSGGATEYRTRDAGVSLILIGLAGYLAPPLIGLAGAVLVLDGKAWSVLLASVVMLFAAFLKAKDWFTMTVLLLAGAIIGWVAYAGGPALQAGVAVGLVWLMLLGGVTTLEGQGWGVKDSDAAKLADRTWIPAFLWVSLFVFVAIVCLWVGARRLLGL